MKLRYRTTNTGWQKTGPKISIGLGFSFSARFQWSLGCRYDEMFPTYPKMKLLGHFFFLLHCSTGWAVDNLHFIFVHCLMHRMKLFLHTSAQLRASWGALNGSDGCQLPYAAMKFSPVPFCYWSDLSQPASFSPGTLSHSHFSTNVAFGTRFGCERAPLWRAEWRFGWTKFRAMGHW